MSQIFFENWESLFRTFIITILAYIAMIVFLRISGKRTLSKMNAFDFIVTVALGSSLATVALNKDVALADGALVFFILIFLQYIITWLSVRVKKAKQIITSQPTLLLYKGNLLLESLKQQRITIEEIYLVAREKGITDLMEIDAIVLETTGELTIIHKVDSFEDESLKDVQKPIK